MPTIPPSKMIVSQELDIQDSSSNAMTEVALGLCMAFFSLLVLALISVSLPSALNIEDAQQSAAEKLIQANKMNLQAPHKQQKQDEANSQDQALVIYWAGTYMDTNKKVLHSKDVALLENPVIAVDPELSFHQLLALQKNFSDQQIQLTSLSEEWLHSLQQSSNHQ